MPRILAITLPGFKSNFGGSTSLTTKNLERHNQELLAQKLKDLETALTACNEEKKALEVEIEGMRQTITAKETNEPGSPETNAQYPVSVKTQEDVQHLRTWLPMTNSDIV